FFLYSVSCSHPCSLFFFSSSVTHRDLHSFPTRRSSDLLRLAGRQRCRWSGPGSSPRLCRWYRGCCIAGPCRGSAPRCRRWRASRDRKSTCLNCSHLVISYAVFCLKKKKKKKKITCNTQI